MFAPALGFAGHAVLAVELAPGPALARAARAAARARARRDARRRGGARPRDGRAAGRDARRRARASGSRSRELDADLDALLPVAPPPFLALLALLARIASGSPETYADIQRANPFAAEARARARGRRSRGSTRPRATTTRSALEALVAQAGEPLGAHREALAAQAAALLARLSAAGPALSDRCAHACVAASNSARMRR